MTGTITAGMGSWLWRQASAALSHEPELLDISTLVPGETYVVSTRPAPTRKERRAAAKLESTRRRVARRTAPDRTTRRALRQLAAAHKRLDALQLKSTSDAISNKALKLEREVRQLDERVQVLTTPSRRTRRIQRRAAALEVAVEAERSKAMAAAARKVRPSRDRTFH